jgi:hypothetical protein
MLQAHINNRVHWQCQTCAFVRRAQLHEQVYHKAVFFAIGRRRSVAQLPHGLTPCGAPRLLPGLKHLGFRFGGIL